MFPASSPSPVDVDVEDKHFKNLLSEWGAKKAESPIKKDIPRFFWKLPPDEDVLRQKLREEARSSFLQRRSRQLLDNSELKALWILLDQNHGSFDDQLISYEDYQKVVAMSGPKVKPYFTASIFARLQQGDPCGRVSIMSLFNYAMRKVWLQQTRIGW